MGSPPFIQGESLEHIMVFQTRRIGLGDLCRKYLHFMVPRVSLNLNQANNYEVVRNLLEASGNLLRTSHASVFCLKYPIIRFPQTNDHSHSGIIQRPSLDTSNQP